MLLQSKPWARPRRPSAPSLLPGLGPSSGRVRLPLTDCSKFPGALVEGEIASERGARVVLRLQEAADSQCVHE